MSKLYLVAFMPISLLLCSPALSLIVPKQSDIITLKLSGTGFASYDLPYTYWNGHSVIHATWVFLWSSITDYNGSDFSGSISGNNPREHVTYRLGKSVWNLDEFADVFPGKKASLFILTGFFSDPYNSAWAFQPNFGSVGNERRPTISASEGFGVVIEPPYSFFMLDTVESFAISAIPEPSSWALMIAGFGMVGGAMRRRSYHLPA